MEQTILQLKSESFDLMMRVEEAKAMIQHSINKVNENNLEIKKLEEQLKNSQIIKE